MATPIAEKENRSIVLCYKPTTPVGKFTANNVNQFIGLTPHKGGTKKSTPQGGKPLKHHSLTRAEPHRQVEIRVANIVILSYFG